MVLSGTITTPSGFTVANAKDAGDNTLGYAVAEGMTEQFDLTFTPVLPQYYSGNVVIDHNAGGASELIAVSGTGLPAPTPDISVNPTGFYVTLAPDNMTDELLQITNTGDASLSYATSVNYPSKYQWLNAGFDP